MSDTTSQRMVLAAFVVAVTLALSNMPTPFYVQWQGQIGFTPSVVALLFSSYIVGLVAALIVVGGLVSVFGNRTIILLGLALGVIAALLFVAGGSVGVLITGRAVSGVAVGAVLAAGIPWIINLAASNQRQRAAALASAAVAGGAALGPLLGGGVSSLFEHNGAAVAFGGELILLGSAFVVTCLLPSTHVALQGSFQGTAFYPRVSRDDISPLFQGISLFSCALGATAFLLSLGPSVLRETSGENSHLLAGMMASSMFFTGAIVQWPGSRLPMTALLISAGSAVVLAAFAITMSVVLHHPAPLLVGSILGGAGYGLSQLAGLTLVSESVGVERLSHANALLNIGGYVPCGLLPVAAGFFVDWAGLANGTLVFACLLSIVTVLVTLVICRARLAQAA
jgi:MFS family permease